MINDELRDPLMRRLSRLAELTPDAQRAARCRARCRAQMRRPVTAEPRLRRVLVAGFCVIYLSALVADVLRLQGIL